MRAIEWLDKYAFLIILLYCLGLFSPELAPKGTMMDTEAEYRATSMSSSNITKQLFWFLAFFYLAWRLVKLNFMSLPAQRQLLTLLMISGLALASVLWCLYDLHNKKSVISAYILLLYFYFFLFIQIASKLCSISIYGYMPDYFYDFFVCWNGGAFGPDGALAGFNRSKNLLGQNLLAMFVMMILLIKLDGIEVKKLYLCLAMIFCFLVLTGSKTSLALAMLFIGLALSGTLIAKFIVGFSFLVLSSVFIFIPGLSYISGEMFHIGQYMEPAAFTGQGLIWDTLYYDMDYFSKVLLGYGYGAYFGVGVIPYFFDDPWSFLQQITSPHNGYLDMFLQFGVLGCSFLISLFITLCAGVKSKWLAGALIVPVIYSFTEAAVFRDQSMMWFLTIVLFAYIADYQEAYQQVDDSDDYDDAEQTAIKEVSFPQAYK